MAAVIVCSWRGLVGRREKKKEGRNVETEMVRAHHVRTGSNTKSGKQTLPILLK
jgi:hypothetical protein